MASLPFETLSIIRGTLAEVRGAQAAVMLRMWHHLEAAPDREAIFEAVGGDGGHSFVEAFLFAAERRLTGRWPRLHGSSRLCSDHGPVLEEAFRRALGDVLGARANPLLLNAWSLALRDFLAEMCGPKGAQP